MEEREQPEGLRKGYMIPLFVGHITAGNLMSFPSHEKKKPGFSARL